MTSMECGLPPTPIDRVLSQEKLDKLGFLIYDYSVLIGMHFIAGPLYRLYRIMRRNFK